ncbi:MAG: hypothetical protein ACRD0S_01415 [Acidimicrobiales bacterium]
MSPTLVAETYRLLVAGGRYRWIAEHRQAASAVWRQHSWDVMDATGEVALVSLVAAVHESRTRIALVDHEGRRATTFTGAEPMTRAQIGTLSDSWGNPLLMVRADGPTGLHLIDPAGNLLALTSRQRSRDAHGCDVLVTAAGAALGRGLVLGMTLALELLRAGALRRVA